MHKQNYDKWLTKWYSNRTFKAQTICKILHSLSKNNSSPIILDIGCHEGMMDLEFSKFTKNKTIGLDISYESITLALQNSKAKNIQNLEFIVSDARFLPIKDDVIDWIICNHMIDYLDDKKSVLIEFKRTLNDDGFIYLSVINKFFLKLYKMFRPLFVPLFGPFYGRTSPSSTSPFGTPMTLHNWKKIIVQTSTLHLFDLTPTLIIKTLQNNQNLDYTIKIKNKFIEFGNLIISNLSGSWVFILFKGNKIN
jgi:ubiquinone/menaquinone biosynthesis C-methylase UbiE